VSENISINVTIGDRMYPLKIRAEDQPLVKKAEQLINQKYSDFQLRFSGQEKLDYLAMSALMNVVDLMKGQSESEMDAAVIKEKLLEASQLIAEGLRKA
jgi:cell division protein ZapA